MSTTSREPAEASDASTIVVSAPRPGEGLRRGLIAFQYRNYRLFWFGQLISVTGTWMQSLAQSWLVVDSLHANAFELAIVNVFQFAPILVLGLFAGVLADRFPKRIILMVTQTTMGILAAVLAWLVATGRVELWHVYALAFLLGLANAFDMPTRQAFVSEMVGREAIMNAVALNSALFNAARIIGPAIAGLLLAVLGAAWCFGLNAVSYIAVIIGLSMMNVTPLVGQVTGSAVQRLREGLSYVRATPDILRPTILIGVMSMFGMNFNVWLPLLAANDFHAGASAFGLLFSAMGAGSLLGALSVAFIGKGPNRGRMLIGAAAMGVFELILAFAAAIPLAIGFGMGALAGAGFCASNTTATANTTVQTTASDELRGRVMAVYTMVFSGSVPFGALISGGIAETFGTPVSIAVGAVVTIATAAWLAWMLRNRLTGRPAAARMDASAASDSRPVRARSGQSPNGSRAARPGLRRRT